MINGTGTLHTPLRVLILCSQPIPICGIQSSFSCQWDSKPPQNHYTHLSWIRQQNNLDNSVFQAVSRLFASQIAEYLRCARPPLHLIDAPEPKAQFPSSYSEAILIEGRYDQHRRVLSADLLTPSDCFLPFTKGKAHGSPEALQASGTQHAPSSYSASNRPSSPTEPQMSNQTNRKIKRKRAPTVPHAPSGLRLLSCHSMIEEACIIRLTSAAHIRSRP